MRFQQLVVIVTVFINARLQDDWLSVRLIVCVLRPLRRQFAATTEGQIVKLAADLPPIDAAVQLEKFVLSAGRMPVIEIDG